MDHLLITLPFPLPDALIQRMQTVHPKLKITYLRHEVHPTEAFTKTEMFIPPDVLRSTTILLTMGVIPEPLDAPNLRLIHFSVAGTDHVSNRPAFRDPKITITTSAGAPSPAVAEWVIGSILAHMRQLFTLRELQTQKTWGRLNPANPALDLVGKRMGIIGYGSIGRQVACIAKALGMDIIVYVSRPRLTEEAKRDKTFIQQGVGDPDGVIPSAYFHGRSKAELHTFLSQNADIIVLSLPLTDETRGLIGEEELTIMNAKKGVYLVNVARGPIIDHSALLSSLKRGPSNGGLRGAALDVTDPEPLPTDSELWTLPNVFISPHISSGTPGTIDRAFKILENNLVRRSKGEVLLNVIKSAETA